MIQRHVWVSGRVQGVGFRAATELEVRRQILGAEKGGDGSELRGFVRNLPDGRVEAVFSGASELVLRIVAWCGHGPRSAHVTRLEVQEEAVDPALPPFGVQP
jgi:acylphosphatase